VVSTHNVEYSQGKRKSKHAKEVVMLNPEAAQQLLSIIEAHNLTGEPWEIDVQLNTPRLTSQYTTRAVPRRTVKTLLVELDKLSIIMAGGTPTAQKLRFFLTDSDYPEIEVFDPMAAVVFQEAIGEGLFTPAEVEMLKDFGKVPVYKSWVQQEMNMDSTQEYVIQALALQGES
jgi:hypothetical protein